MGKPIMKFFMIGVNVVFWAFGGTLLGLGIWMAVDPDAFDSMDATGMDDALWAAAVYTMIGVGAGVFLLGFLGCCGSIRGGEGKRNIMLKLYIALVSVIMLAEIVVIILTAIFWGNINDSVRDRMRDDIKTEYISAPPNDGDGVSHSWNKMQYEWECCGSYDYRDYQGSDYTANTGNAVPFTCCKYVRGSDYENEDNVNYDACLLEARLPYDSNRHYENLNARGCYNEMSKFFDQNAAIIIGVTCGVIALQILGIIFACCIMND